MCTSCFMNVHSFQVTYISQRIKLNILSLCLKNQGVQTVANACLCINNTISIIEAPVICNYSKQTKIQPLSFSFLFFNLIIHTRPKHIIRLKSYKRNVNLNSPQYTHVATVLIFTLTIFCQCYSTVPVKSIPAVCLDRAILKLFLLDNFKHVLVF